MSLDPASSAETGRGRTGAGLDGESREGRELKSRDELTSEIEVLRDRISRLSAASLRISASLDPNTVLSEVVDSACALTGARYGVITTIGDAGEPEDFVSSGYTADEHRQIVGSKGTLLKYWNNFIPASEPWLAENEQPTLNQARLNGPDSQLTLSNYPVSSPCCPIQGISESPDRAFPVMAVIQQRSLFPLFSSSVQNLSRVGIPRRACFG